MKKLVIITAPLASTGAERDFAAEFLQTRLGQDVVVFIHVDDWKVDVHDMPDYVPGSPDEVACEAIRHGIELPAPTPNLGPSKPPPPPPPPAAIGPMICKGCGKGPQGHSMIETMPPIVKWCDGTKSTWDSYPNSM